MERFAKRYMNPNWLIQEDVFNEDFSDLYSALDKQNNKYHVYKYIPFSSELITPLDDSDCVITYGSLNLAKIVQRTKKWIPGCWCNFENFRCLNYYAYYGKYLLNKDYSAIPLLEIIRLKEELYQRYGDPIFVRPDKGDKPFTGHTINYYEFESQIKYLLSLPTCYEQLIVLVSSNKNIKRESRFIVSGKQVITGSVYIENNDFKDRVRSLCECGDAFEFAKNVAQENWEPDPVYVIDVAETSDEIGLLELNSFSCSGFYASDKNKIVEAVNLQAINEFNDYD